MVYEPNNLEKISSAYKSNESIDTIAGNESIADKLMNSYTKIDEISKDAYSIDNCGCPPCGCLKGNLLLVLSPAGVATAGTIFAGSSVM